MRNEKGFSLIELVTIVMIIATLALIAIPQFSNYRSRAYNDSALSDLRSAMTAQEAYFSDNHTYSHDKAVLETQYQWAYNPKTEMTINSADNASYTMEAYQPAGNQTYIIVGPGGSITKK
jgi:type IV pilus assembly protein PilA